MKKNYDWKKTAEKVIVSIIEVGIAGIAAVYADNPFYLGLVPIIEGVKNYVKHRK